MKKKRIITDTNIWYTITNEEILNISQKYQLVIPIIILNEIYTSPNITLCNKTFEDLKKAINTILENLNNIQFIELYPFQYLRKDSYVIETKISDFYINEFEALIKLDYETVKENGAKKGDISGLTKFINDTSLNYKKTINRNLESKNNFKKLDTLKNTEALILKYANDILEIEKKNHQKITELTIENELLLKTFDQLLREISRTNKKIENNDWTDIFNLIYVGTDDLYWTNEISKKNLIIELQMEKYLFEK